MKIHHPARWGVVLALLSTPVASQSTSCSTIDDCPDMMYCNSNNNLCLAMGDCVEVADCSDPTNGPFAQALCMGTQICTKGKCGIECGVFPEDPLPPKCTSHSDCPAGDSGVGSGMFCAADGYCERMGGCAVPEDCYVDENQGFPIAACFGSMECVDRKCGMNCSGGSDALFMCQSAEDCPEPNSYCDGYETCRAIGSCITDGDCSAPGNFYPQPACVGKVFCGEGGSCSKDCNSAPIDRCKTSTDCTDGEYCAGDGICQEYGFCQSPGDCLVADNIFPMIECIGTVTCEMGQCGMICGSDEDNEDRPCDTSEDCLENMFCNPNNQCLKQGSCIRPEDCTAIGNDIMLPACVGTVTCELGQCGKTCDTFDPVDNDETKSDNASAVTIDVISCSTDDDCNSMLSTANERSAAFDTMYCAQGVCTKQGDCFSDEDCINPNNVLWNDKKCFGYLHCTDEGKCDRECGVNCKNGSRAAECFANPCDTEEWKQVEGAVSCVMTTCEGGCDTVLFSASGAVLTELGEDAADSSIGLEKNQGADKDLETLPEMDNQILNLESSAVRATSMTALLAAVLVVAIV